MNVIIELKNLIEQLINERGSAAIKQERIELLNDKFSIIKAASDQLEIENKNLKLQLIDRDNEITRLNELLNILSENKNEKSISEFGKKLLKKIFDGGEYDTCIEEMSQLFSESEGIVKYHLDILLDLKLIVKGMMKIDYPRGYLLTKEGRKYVVENIMTK